MKYDIALYGNLTIDEIHKDGGIEWQFGGIANIERHLAKIAPNLTIAIVPAKVSYYHIENGKAEELYAMNQNPHTVEATWHHWSYIDESITFVRPDSFASQGSHFIAGGGYKVQHSPSGSVLYHHDKKIKTVKHKVEKGIDALGAGDMLAAEIIYVLFAGDKLEDEIRAVHEGIRYLLCAR